MVFIELFLWFTIWFGYYFVLNYILIPRKITFRKGRFITTSITLIFFLVSLLVFKINLNYFSLESFATIFMIILFMGILFLPFHLFFNKKREKFVFRKQNPILGRFSEIGLQQLMLFVLSTVIFRDSPFVFLLAGITFGIAHIPILFLKRLKINWKIFVILSSTLSGTLFSWVIISVDGGWFWTYVIHLTFYFFLGIFTGDDDQILP